MRCIKNCLPECILNVAARRETLTEVNRLALFSQSIEHRYELSVCLVVVAVHLFDRSFDKHVCLVVAVKRPMVLIETTQCHHTAVIYLNSFHMQVLKRLFCDFGPIFLKSVEQVAIQVRLVARLISIAGSDDFKRHIAFSHCFDQLIFKFVDVLNIRLYDSNLRLCSLDHVQDLLANVSLVRGLLLKELALGSLLVISHWLRVKLTVKGV